MAPSPQGRRWCFTLNNPTLDECQSVVELASGLQVVYAVVGDEVSKTGTPHLQGFIVFVKKHRLSKIKKWIPRAHFELAFGLSSEAAAYCKKAGKWEEYGECPADTRISSKSNQDVWADAKKYAQSGELELIRNDIYIRYYRTLKLIRDDTKPRPPCNNVMHNFWFWGPTGTGKSRFVEKNFPDAYSKMLNKWWDLYLDQPVVLINEFGKKHDKLSEFMKIWSDHYPFLCERKGGALMIRPTVIFVTSNYPPDAIWSEEEILEPLYRRFRVFKFPDEKPSQELTDHLHEIAKLPASSDQCLQCSTL